MKQLPPSLHYVANKNKTTIYFWTLINRQITTPYKSDKCSTLYELQVTWWENWKKKKQKNKVPKLSLIKIPVKNMCFINSQEINIYSLQQNKIIPYQEKN